MVVDGCAGMGDDVDDDGDGGGKRKNGDKSVISLSSD